MRRARAAGSARCVALFREEAAREAGALLARRTSSTAASCRHRRGAEQDWVRLTQSQFEPVEITPQF
jgi:ribosomal protein L11 methyltransferase